MIFAKEIVSDGTIKVFNGGDMYRDFTYIDDIVNGILKVVYGGPKKNSDGLFYKIYNISYGQTINLMDFIHELENGFGKEVNKEYLPMQDGDVYLTYGSTIELVRDYGYKPSVDLKSGVKQFVKWYKDYYKVGK